MSLMTLFPKLQLDSVRTISIGDQARKMSEANLSRPFTPEIAGEFALFLRSLPSVLKAADLQQFCLELATIHADGNKIALMLGGHVIKTGLAPVLIDLMR